MSFVVADRVRETNVITGTGAVTLGGSVTGYRNFSTVMANTQMCWYTLVDNTAGAWEVGLGTWNTGNTLSRNVVLSSSNSGSLVSFAGNPCDCFMTMPASVGANLGPVGPVLRGFLGGMGLAWVSTTTFSVAVGQVASDDATTLITLASALTKSTSAWVAGNNNGSLDTGSIAAGTWYHAYAIYNPTTNIADALTSLSASAPTMPSGYTFKRRLGSLLTDGSSHYIQFVQNRDKFEWLTPVNDIVSNTPGVTTGALVTLASVPTGVIVEALLTGDTSDASTTGILYLSNPAQTDVVPSVSALTTLCGAQPVGYNARVMTNTSAQIRRRMSSTTSQYLASTNGWIDNRGQG